MSEQKLHLTIDASARELQEEISRSAESIQNLGNVGMNAGKKVASSMDKAASATARVGDETQMATGRFETDLQQ